MMNLLTDWDIFETIRNWYGRFERPISSLSLIGGFVFDALTLRHVGQTIENVWVVVHLLIVAVCIIWINRTDLGIGDEKNPQKIHFWLVNVMQFFFGGILSTYLVFYFRSGAFSVNWPFILILALAFWANESLKREFVRLSFQITFFYLSLFGFAIFLIPVLLHQIGTAVFIFSGIVSLVCMAGFLLILEDFTHAKFADNKKIVILSVGIIFVVVNALYFADLIPPIPLSLTDSGVYHSVVRDGAGGYTVQTEQKSWTDYFTFFEKVHAGVTDSVYIYSSIFSPADLNITVLHKLQYFNPDTERWVDKNIIYLPVIGGREGGFRTYSVQSGLAPGEYRVEVQTLSGQTIGTIRFAIVAPTPGMVLKIESK